MPSSSKSLVTWSPSLYKLFLKQEKICNEVKKYECRFTQPHWTPRAQDLCYGSKPQEKEGKKLNQKKKAPSEPLSHLWVDHLILYLTGCNQTRDGKHSLPLSFFLKSSFFSIQVFVILHKNMILKLDFTQTKIKILHHVALPVIMIAKPYPYHLASFRKKISFHEEKCLIDN